MTKIDLLSISQLWVFRMKTWAKRIILVGGPVMRHTKQDGDLRH